MPIALPTSAMNDISDQLYSPTFLMMWVGIGPASRRAGGVLEVVFFGSLLRACLCLCSHGG